MFKWIICIFKHHQWRKSWNYHSGNECLRCGEWDQER